MTQKIKLIITIINLPRLIFHIIIFLRYYAKCKDDVYVACKHKNYLPVNKKLYTLLAFSGLIVFDRFFRNVFYYRIGYLKYLIQFLAPGHQSFTIGTYSIIGKGLLAIHPFSSVINALEIGNNLIIKNDVTIGNSNGYLPKIGDNVTINVNSVIVGKIRIGNNVTIGTCTLIRDNVPDNCTVVGNPAKIIYLNGVPCNISLKEYNCKIEERIN